MTTTITTSTPTTTESRYGDVIALVLVAAFTLSVAHTVYAAVQGLEDPDFTLTTPLTWIFYGVGFSMAALARRDAAWAQGLVLAFLVLVIAIGALLLPHDVHRRRSRRRSAGSRTTSTWACSSWRSS